MPRISIFLLVAVSTLTSFVLIEGILRLVKPAPVAGIQEQPCISVPNEATGYRYSPNAISRIHRFFEMDNVVEINSRGFHDKSWDRAERGRKVLAIGDSFTSAIHVSVNKTWSQAAERRLQAETDEDIFILNAGIGGTGTVAHANLASELIPQTKPEVLVLMYFFNDVSDYRIEPIYRECFESIDIAYQSPVSREVIVNYIRENKRWLSAGRFLLETSYIARVINFHTKTWPILNVIDQSAVGIPWKERRSIDDYSTLFRTMNRIAEEHEAIFLILGVPPKFFDGYPSSYETVRGYIDMEKIVVCDLRPRMDEIVKARGFDWRQLFWQFDGHYNEIGNEIMGIAAAKILSRFFTSPESGGANC